MKIWVNLMLFLLCIGCVSACKELGMVALNPEECCSKTIEGSKCVERKIELSIHPSQFNLKIEAGKVFKDIVTVVNKDNDSIYVGFSTSEVIELPYGIFEIKPTSRKVFEFEFTTSKNAGLIEEQNIRVSVIKSSVKMIKDLPVNIEIMRAKQKPIWIWVILVVIILGIGIFIYKKRRTNIK